jgi:Ni,Fe-hydrogenase III small subunit/ferredoxin
MPWVTRGIREGIVTSRYPHRPDGYGPSFHAAVRVRDPEDTVELDQHELETVIGLCPTQAISADRGRFHLDQGRCIGCGRCVVERPDIFSFQHDVETAQLSRRLLVVPPDPDEIDRLPELRAELAQRVKALRRSIHLRHVDCGSDGAEEWEIAALTNPIYDVQRLGIYFTASPRHADLLLVTGAGAAGMLAPLQTTFESIPYPKVIVAVGSDAASGGMLSGTYATRDGVVDEVPVDVFVPGSPPSPFSILHGILLAIGLLPSSRSAREARR